MRRLLLLALAAAPSAALAQERTALSRTWIAGPARAAPAWFLCDVLDRPQAIVVGPRGAAGRSTRATVFDKTRGGVARSADYDIGPGDPGAGQVYYPVRRGGAEAGSLHAVNPGMVADPPGALTPTLMSARLGADGGACRWAPGVRLLGLTSRRTVMITRSADGRLRYKAFGFPGGAPIVESGPGRSTAPDLRLDGGREARWASGSRFTFAGRGGYAYQLDAPNAAGRPATLTVLKDGRLAQRETLLAYTWAPPAD